MTIWTIIIILPISYIGFPINWFCSWCVINETQLRGSLMNDWLNEGLTECKTDLGFSILANDHIRSYIHA